MFFFILSKRFHSVHFCQKEISTLFNPSISDEPGPVNLFRSLISCAVHQLTSSKKISLNVNWVKRLGHPKFEKIDSVWHWRVKNATASNLSGGILFVVASRKSWKGWACPLPEWHDGRGPTVWGVNDGPSSDNKSKAFFIWNENLKWLHFDHFCQIENSNVEVFRYNFRLSADESGLYTCFTVSVQFIHWLHSSKTLELNVNWENFNHFCYSNIIVLSFKVKSESGPVDMFRSLVCSSPTDFIEHTFTIELDVNWVKKWQRLGLPNIARKMLPPLNSKWV